MFPIIDVSVKDWRRKLLHMAAESIKANYDANNDENKEAENKIDNEVKLLMQRQDWLDGMKQVILIINKSLQLDIDLN